MGMFRTFNTMPICNTTVILVAICLLLCYVVYIWEFLFILDAGFKWYVIPISAILFVLLYWTYLKVYLTEPGSVPQFYAVNVKWNTIK